MSAMCRESLKLVINNRKFNLNIQFIVQNDKENVNIWFSQTDNLFL